MKRTLIIRIVVSLAALIIVATPIIQAQDKGKVRDYKPRVIGRSNSMIVEGRIADIRGDRITIKSSRGLRYDFRIDGQTTALGSGDLVSIATMGDIALSVSDLRVNDWVEVVAERAGRSPAARIITRIKASGAIVASRQ